LRNFGVIEAQDQGSLLIERLISNNGSIAVAYPTASASIAGTGDPAETGSLLLTAGQMQSSRTVYVNDSPGSLLSVQNGTRLRLEGDLLGNLVNRAAFLVPSTLQFDRSAPYPFPFQSLEAMGIQRTLGKPEDYDTTFVIGNLNLANQAWVKLVDNS